MAQYELKTAYVARQLEENHFIGLFEQICDDLETIGTTLDWSQAKDIGIDSDAFSLVMANTDKLGLYFCHPNVLVTIPNALKYYRCISVLSQKGLKVVSRVSSIDQIEEGKSVEAAQAQLIATAINRNLSVIHKASFASSEKLKGLMYATAGITIDGSWKNAIGSEGERVVKAIILRHALQNGELAGAKVGELLHSGKTIDADWIAVNAGAVKSVIFSNGSAAEFGSEPDVTLLDSAGKTVAGIEVKAGLDPAGALERLGAMLKSFDSIIETSPSADRILVVACITDEVENRLKTAKAVTRYYSLTDIMLNKNKNEVKFANMIRGVLGLVVAKM